MPAKRPVSSALGLESHSGWAVLVALAGPVGTPALILRERVELADPKDGGAKQPFHAAERMAFPKAKAFLAAAAADAQRRARRELGRVLAGVEKAGWKPARCAVLLSSGRALPALESVLASHALIHAAEGDHFRDALAEAAEFRGLEVVRIPRKELPATAGKALGISPESLGARVAALGKTAGPPWGHDQKLAALAAWACLGRIRR
ncbi:MAG TPA: hypothetical protein VIZ69_07705 [Thermoanaerobaculia bacterium]